MKRLREETEWEIWAAASHQNRRRAETTSRVSTQRTSRNPNVGFFVRLFLRRLERPAQTSERQQVKKSIRRNEAFIQARDTAVTTPV